jgi:hypothetical protein
MNEHEIIAGVPTNPVEYAKQMHRLFEMNPTLTVKELALKIGKSEEWILSQISLYSKERAERELNIAAGAINQAMQYAESLGFSKQVCIDLKVAYDSLTTALLRIEDGTEGSV